MVAVNVTASGAAPESGEAEKVVDCEVPVTVMVTDELPLEAVYVPGETYMWVVAPIIPFSLITWAEPSPKEIDPLTPENVTSNGTLPYVGDAERFEEDVTVPLGTQFCAHPLYCT